MVKANPVKCAGNFAGLFAQTAVLFAHVYAALGLVYMSKQSIIYLKKFGQSYFIWIQNLSK